MNRARRDRSPSDIQDRLLWRLLHLAFWLGMSVLGIFAAIYVWHREVVATVIQLAGMAAMAGGYLLAFRTRRPLLGLQLVGIAAWLLLATIIIVHGGLHAASLPWIVMLGPLLTLAGVGMAVHMTVATVLLIGALYAAEATGWLPPYVPVPLEQRALSAALMAVLFSVFTTIALRWRIRLADELETARDAAVEASRHKDRFIAYLNHEIRTPANALVAGARLLGRQPASADRGELVRVMQRSADHLLTLVNDVLDHARLEAGAMRIEAIEFSLRDVADGAIEMFGGLARAKQIDLSLQWPDDELRDQRVGDPTRLRQILANLLSNAVKFTPDGGRVVLRVSEAAAGPASDVMLLEVQDNGAGMAPEVQARLFKPFDQGDVSIARRHGGTGLGLAICKELVGLMRGSIEVESVPQRGSAFRVRVPLPVAEPDPRRPTPAPTPTRPSAGLQILLVEDDEVNRLVMEALLRDTGAEVAAAESGARALQMLSAEVHAPDLVLMDCQMAGLDGLATTRRWREEEQRLGRARVPIVALTGDAHPGARAACLDAGMDDYLTKPVSAGDLAAVLARWGGGAR